MTSYDDTKVQLTINRMTEECYENVPNKSSTELYLVSQNPTSIAKIDLDAQSRTDAEISSIQSDLNVLQQDLNGLSTEVSTLTEWTTTQIDDLIGDVQEVSSQTAQNAQDIADISANLTHSTVRRWEYVEYNGLTFTAEEANSTVAMQKWGSAPDVSLEYSTGDGWNDFIVGETTVTLPNIGDQMVMRAKTTNPSLGSLRYDGVPDGGHRFTMSGSIYASGSIMYLLDKNGSDIANMGGACFMGLFRDCKSLRSSPSLPSTSLPGACYEEMFMFCTFLTTPPELPATTLTERCYYRMFRGCSRLTTPPQLPSTELARFCYDQMLYDCTSLVEAPELPATTMKECCYRWLMKGCTALTTPPELPATTMANDCYRAMFMGCTSLTQAPELPATALANYCYREMFDSCTSLTTAPELPATALAEGCYYDMFWGCSSLNEIKIAYTGNFSGTGVPADAFNNWVSGVAASGTFYYDGEDTTTGNSAIPTGWEVRGNTLPGLTFTAEEANSTVAMQKVGNAPNVSLEYTTDGSTWNDFIVSSTDVEGTTVTLPNVGDKMFLRAKTTNSTFATGENVCNCFVITGKVAASGSIMYLLKNDGDLDTISSNYCFHRLFSGCSSLTTAPELSATALAAYCYYYMFDRCTSLTQAPELPATTLANRCYEYMFRDCTSLTTAPELSATTLAGWCFHVIFAGCSSLNEIKIAYTGNFSGTGVPTLAFFNWVVGVASTGILYYNGSDTTTGASAIPEGWTVQTF